MTAALRFVLLLLSFPFGISLQAQEIKSIGVPYVQNYLKSEYLSGNQNWAVARDAKGVMYFGNAEGLLSYDGGYWQLHKMPNRQIVRSVATDKLGRVYTGSFGEFGYWSIIKGEFTYSSLVSLIPDNQGIKDEIWKIYATESRIIFQSFSKIYIYEKGKINVISGPGTYLFMHQVGNHYYVEALGKGLQELKGNKLIPLKNTGTIFPSEILSILPFKDNKLLIGTSKGGLYLYDGQEFKVFESPVNSFLKVYQLNNGCQLLNKYYAYGTILNGIVIVDEDGNIVQRINKAHGLQNNTVLSLFTDQNENLWAGLDNGIDRIELNSPLYFYFDKSGQFGTVYSSIIYGKNIYLGTNQGLFSSQWPTSNGSFDFKLVPKSQGQVWDLTMLNGQLICGHNEGTFKLSGLDFEKISSVKGAWTTKPLMNNPDYLVQGNYTGLVVFKKDPSGNWKFLHQVKGFDEPSRHVEQDARGDIWVSHAYKGLYKLRLAADLTKVTNVKSYTTKNGLPSEFNVGIFNIENRIVFSTDRGFMLYDEISDKFSRYESLNSKLGGFSTANKVINAGSGKYWFVNSGKVGLADVSVGNNIRVDSNKFSMLDGRMVQYYENISRISRDMYLISVDDGFVIYNEISPKAKKPTKLPAVLIRKVEDVTDTYKVIVEDADQVSIPEIAYNRNNLRIIFALPYYRKAKIKFQYYLEGYSKQWSDWNESSEKDFTNLNAGSYVFKVRAKVGQEGITEISEFKFRILPPFYASGWALVIYLIVAALLLLFSKRLYERKLLKDKRALTRKLQLEKEEFMKEEAAATEKQIIKLQTEKLQVELAGKNREIANSAMSLVYKNELLQKISQEMYKLKDSNGKLLEEDHLRKIQKVIDEGMNDERDWNLFESSFNEAHESFFKKLKANHPDLVPNDLKLCAYLHMNMSSKEMASLLNISLRGVEIRRYRLRKKLDVPHDKNLVEFLMEL